MITNRILNIIMAIILICEFGIIFINNREVVICISILIIILLYIMSLIYKYKK